MDDIAPIKTKLISGKTKAPGKNVERVKALKGICCKCQHMWPKTKLKVDYNIYITILKELLIKYNKEIKKSRQNYFSQILTENLNNSKFLFNWLILLRPLLAELHSSEKWKEFAPFF